MTIFLTGTIGFLSAFIGFLPGMLTAWILGKNVSYKAQASMLGFSGGVLLSFVSFELVPKAYDVSGFFLGTIGLVSGVLAAMIFSGDDKTGEKAGRDKKNMESGVFLAVSMMIHNFPEGVAFGALNSVSASLGIKMAILMSLHFIPESMAVFIILGKEGYGKAKQTFLMISMTLPMVLGSILGFFCGFSPVLTALSLSFSGGIMIFIVCSDIIPESAAIWRNKITALFSAAGFVFGIIISVL